MLGLLRTQATQGNEEAIQTLATLRAMGLIDDEPKVEREPTLSEIFDMCVAGSKQRKRDYWLQKHQ
jgi:hypothetical protein